MIESVFLQDKENCLEFFASLSNESKVKDILYELSSSTKTK